MAGTEGRSGGRESIKAPRIILAIASSFLATVLASPAAAAARTIDWSGRTWDVRAAGFGGPGPNQWSDSTANVSVEGGELVLSIVQDASGNWTCPELSLPVHLGYGTYRWVVDSDLRQLDTSEVLGLFTYGGPAPSNNEIDIEASHWGNLAWPTGSATTWLDANAGLRNSQPFSYAGPPPYLNQFTWSPGSIHWLVLDATGATVFDWTTTTDVPVPSTETPYINYWRYAGVAPAGPKSMRLSSFTWLPPGDPNTIPPHSGAIAGGGVPQPQQPAPGGNVTSAPAAAVPSPPAAAEARLNLSIRPRRFALHGRGARGEMVWTASGPATVRIQVDRQLRTGRFAPVGTIVRLVQAGREITRFPAQVDGRALRAGRYRLDLSSAGAKVGFARRHLRFTVVRG